MMEFIIKCDHPYTNGMQEIVRCKDCAWSNKEEDPWGGIEFECTRNGSYHDSEFFCSEGERKHIMGKTVK